MEEKLGTKKSKDISQTVHQGRKTWSKSFDFVFNLVGIMVGLGNVWRFPFLCYKNGGGAFLIPYVIFVVLLVYPMAILESALGQYTGKSSAKQWSIIPLMKGIGYVIPIIVLYSNMFYAVILAWIFRWFFASFSSPLPWSTCNNEWNTDNCAIIQQKVFNGTSTEWNTTTWKNATVGSSIRSSSVEEYWRRHILDMSSGIEEIGSINWELCGYLLLVWVLMYVAVCKGIAWTSKIVYVTATLPIVMLVIVAIKGATLDGAANGIRFYLMPDLSKLMDMNVWYEAASQVTYSFGIASGSISTLSKNNKRDHNFIRDQVILACANGASSFLSGFAIFSVLGYLAKSLNTTIADVAESGPGLIFVVYPTALSLFPLPQLWSALFFLTLLLIGMDSLFVFQETTIPCLNDLFPKLFAWNHSKVVLRGVMAIVLFIFGIPFVTQGGMYIFDIFNAHAVAGWCLLFIILSEMITIGWIYGADKMCDNIEDMLGRPIQRLWLKICWKYICPIMAIIPMIYSVVQYQPLTYDRTYVYPVWANVFGWMLTLSSILWIPGTAIYVLARSEGNSIGEKFRNSIKPQDEKISDMFDLKMEMEKLKAEDIGVL